MDVSGVGSPFAATPDIGGGRCLAYCESLAISNGEGGARLSHSHARQYGFVLQSLTLWREIANDMFRLWCLAEEDLLRKDNGYEQRDTGQGLQRVQTAPRTSRAMQQLLQSWPSCWQARQHLG